MVKEPKIVYCQCSYGERFEQTKACVRRVRPHVDKMVLIHDGTFTPEQMDWFKYNDVELYYKRWEDWFSDYRNEYIKHVEDGDWVLVSDPDELFNETFCKVIRGLITRAEEQGFDMICINSHDINLDTGEEHVSDFFKNLLFKKYPTTKYGGKVHEQMYPAYMAVHAPKECFYQHVKTDAEVWERAARNFHIAGGGINLMEKNPKWIEWRKLTDKYGLKTWNDMRAICRRGNLPQDLKDWLVAHRNDNDDNSDSEVREFFKWYFDVLHPEENTGNWESVPNPKSEKTELYHFIENTYIEILGRHPDPEGFAHYMKEIGEGKLNRTQFIRTLEESDEYKKKKIDGGLK